MAGALGDRYQKLLAKLTNQALEDRKCLVVLKVREMFQGFMGVCQSGTKVNIYAGAANGTALDKSHPRTALTELGVLFRITPGVGIHALQLNLTDDDLRAELHMLSGFLLDQ